MKKRENDVKLNMFEHSKAKVELYATYLSTYLNILSRASFINRIHIYDLMCGEGKYLDGSKGSPIVALEKIKEHYFSNNKSCPNIKVWFNDKDKSEIDSAKYKVERVQEFSSKLFVPSNVDVKYTKQDYISLLPEVKESLRNLKNDRALLFIDPYGYKEVQPNHLREFLYAGKTEIILFLPITHMYRFMNKSLNDPEFSGGAALREFFNPLLQMNPDLEGTNSVYGFIDKLKSSLKSFLAEYRIFVDTFTLERNEQNIYCLFFFTPHILGFEKMLDAKWKMDEQQGKGFKLHTDQQSLFSEIQTTDYSSVLKSYILAAKNRSNSDLYLFGLENGFLPKHTNEVLRMFQKTIPNFKVLTSDGKAARKGAFYLKYENFGDNPKKRVTFTYETED